MPTVSFTYYLSRIFMACFSKKPHHWTENRWRYVRAVYTSEFRSRDLNTVFSRGSSKSRGKFPVPGITLRKTSTRKYTFLSFDIYELKINFKHIQLVFAFSVNE